MTRSPWRVALERGLLAALAASPILGVVANPPHHRATAAAQSSGDPGSAGVNPSLPATSSAMTVQGHGYFSDLSVTVNQTRDLINQAVSVSWKGCTNPVKSTSGCGPTFGPAGSTFTGNYGGDYLQIMQCWSDPSASEPTPQQCEYGGESTKVSTYPVQQAGAMYTRILSEPSWSDYSSSPGWLDKGSSFKIEPFQAVDGTTVDQQANYNYLSTNPPGSFWLNPYFSINDTNEIDFSRIYPDGTGTVQFQVDTGLEAPGLGCGQNIEPQKSGPDVIPKCWLVVVPRGLPAQENPTGTLDQNQIYTSPLSPTAWANRIVVPLDFTPIGASCAIGQNERRIVGDEMAAPAVSSWETALCSLPGQSPYNYTYMSDDEARQQVVQDPAAGAPGMAVVSRPVSSSALSISPVAGDGPYLYAPLTISGLSVSFKIERRAGIVDGKTVSSELPYAGTTVAQLNLTPRLMAKLLTQSYGGQFFNMNLGQPPSGYTWLKSNPVTLVNDPDFLQYNPEFKLLSTLQLVEASGLIVEEPPSDAAAGLWQWILADPAAAAWLSGIPDQWGMKVNPIYETSASNSTGAAFVPGADFPRSDPYCYDPQVKVGTPPQPVRPLCSLDWLPYALNMQFAASETGSGNPGAITQAVPSQNVDTYWQAAGPQTIGTVFVMAVTDTASAYRYGLQTAALSSAGDDGTSPSFVPPTTETMLAAVQNMDADASTGVLVTNPKSVQGAYPLTQVTYAAVQPGGQSPAARSDYANFIKYAVSSGQVSGSAPGELPFGYVPLTSGLQSQAKSVATELVAPPTAATTTTTVSRGRSVPTSGRDGQPGGGQESIGLPPSPSDAASQGGTSPSSTGTGSTSSYVGASTSPTGVPTHAAGAEGASSAPTTAEGTVYRTAALRFGSTRLAVPILFILFVVAAGSSPFWRRRPHLEER